MALNSEVNRNELIRVFPDLKDDADFEILSPCSETYNCIAWAMQYDDRWVDGENAAGHWWPDGVEREMTSEALIHAFEAVGFVRTDNHEPEEGGDKVVLYKKQDEDEWTHAARVLSGTKEYSKFGKMWDGTHSAGTLSNIYGIAYAYMKRERPYKPLTLRGSISVNQTLLADIKLKLKK